MILWLDAQAPPKLATWMAECFDLEALAVRDLGYSDAEDSVIFEAARKAGATVMTKDVDFVRLLERHGPPPQVVWITCGNTTNEALGRILCDVFPEAIRLIGEGEALVEISGGAPR